MSTKKDMASPVTVATRTPRVAPPRAMAKVSSWAFRGGIRVSTMLPWDLAMLIDEEVLEKEFWMIAIMIRPGARNS